MQSLKKAGLLRTYYRDGLRGYRLTAQAKKLLLEQNPERYAPALTGCSDTNHIKSEITRRLRLHRIAEATVTMRNAGVSVFRDEKPDIFAREWHPAEHIRVRAPAFYNSREIKELGTVFVKIRGARAVGVLLTEETPYVVYNLGGSLMKWEYKAEMRTKALMKTVLCRERLSGQYHPDAVQGLLFGNSMELAFELLSNSGGKNYFVLDGNYENFYFLTNDRCGDMLLRLLCDAERNEELMSILQSGLKAARPGWTIENDAVDEDGNPVLFAYTCNLPRIVRFNTALSLQGRSGTLICFDYQREAMRRYCCERVQFQTLDFEKTERRLFFKRGEK